MELPSKGGQQTNNETTSSEYLCFLFMLIYTMYGFLLNWMYVLDEVVKTALN